MLKNIRHREEEILAIYLNKYAKNYPNKKMQGNTRGNELKNSKHFIE